MPRSDRLMSTQEAADYLGIPLATLYQWRTRGLADGTKPPKGMRVGRYVKYRESELDKWLKTREDY